MSDMELELPTTLGGRILRARKEQGMTQQQVADRLPPERARSRAAIAQYEKDSNHPSLATLYDLASILHVAPSYLADGSGRSTYTGTFEEAVDVVSARSWTRGEALAIKALIDAGTVK